DLGDSARTHLDSRWAHLTMDEQAGDGPDDLLDCLVRDSGLVTESVAKSVDGPDLLPELFEETARMLLPPHVSGPEAVDRHPAKPPSLFYQHDFEAVSGR